MGKLKLKGDLLGLGLVAEDEADGSTPSLRAGMTVGGDMGMHVRSVPTVPVSVAGGATQVGVLVNGPVPDVPVTVSGGSDDVGVTVQGGDEPLLVKLAKLRLVPNLTLKVSLYGRHLLTLKLTGEAKLEPMG